MDALSMQKCTLIIILQSKFDLIDWFNSNMPGIVTRRFFYMKTIKIKVIQNCMEITFYIKAYSNPSFYAVFHYAVFYYAVF